MDQGLKDQGVRDQGLFATASLAARIERAEADMVAAGAEAARLRLSSVVVEPLAGGVGVFIDDGSPFNKIVGLGFGGVPDVSPLARVEEEFFRHGARVTVELSSLGDPAVAGFFSHRGYQVVGFENVLGLPLTKEVEGVLPAVDSIAIARTTEDEDSIWMNTVADGFLAPDTFDGPASHESFDRDALERAYRDMLRAAGFERYLARLHGEVAGGAGLRLTTGVAQLAGAATLPPFRRRGVQTALLRHRLASAAARGCDIAVVTTQPGSKSQENVQQFGFRLMYVRLILARTEGPGTKGPRD